MNTASKSQLSLSHGGVAPAGNADGKYHTNVRPEMRPFVPAAARRILDVGCGAGVFAAALKRERPGAEVWGVEPEALAHASAAKVLDHAVHGLFDEALGLPTAYFDAIVFNDSLEHFSDHRPALQLALRLLAPGGVLVASVPNVRYWPHLRHYLFEADWRYQDEGIRDHTHLRFFTRRSLVRSLQEAGFEVLATQGINPCWAGLRRRVALALLPAGMQDVLYLQFAVTARAAGPAAPQDPRPQR
jgi:SAM-dependent methyltransferase